MEINETCPCAEPSARIPAVSDNESQAMADMELCGDRYGASVFELCKPLDIVEEAPGFFVPLTDETVGSVAFGSRRAA